MSVSAVRGHAARKRRKKMIVAAAIAAVVILLAVLERFVPFQMLLPAYAIPARAEGEIRIHFFDVGQGDCTILEFPDGATLLVDAGDGSFETENRLLRYIKGLHPTSLSLIATHADYDHYGGFADVIAYCGATEIYLPVLDTHSRGYRRIFDNAARTGCEIKRLTRYGVITNSCGAYAVCISPFSAEEETDDNDSSAVIYVSMNGVNLLLGGDISATRERALLALYEADSTVFDAGRYAVRLEDTDILKVSHHGSAYSSSTEWLNLLGVRTAVFSCGQGNSYFHPAAESVLRLALSGAELYRTDELGTIVISVTDGNYTVYTD